MEKFETDAIDFVLNTCKTFVLQNFNINDRSNKTINYKNNIYKITVHKNCYHGDKYFEDYCIYFSSILFEKMITSSFYLEWENNIIGSKLIPANTHYEPNTNTFSNRSIKIRYDEIVDRKIICS
jgi:hypothetical protein